MTAVTVPAVVAGESERDYVVRLNLAKRSRGRMPAAALAALDAARAAFGADVFPAKAVKPAAAPRPAVAVVPAAARVRVAPAATGTYDPKVVRAWAEAEGLVEKGKRGRLPGAVLARYMSTDGGVVAQRAKPVVVTRVKVRPETQAFGFYRRRAGEPSFISEPLLVITNCGRCSDGVAYCKCDGGPRMPEHAGGEVAVLDPKPVV